MKFEVLEQLKPRMESNVMKLDGLTVKFCGKNADPPAAEANLLPLMIHKCPDDFSTLDYYDVRRTAATSGFCFKTFSFQSLKAEHVGRLLIYSKVLAGSTILVKDVKWVHGFAVIPRELTQAAGRGNNKVKRMLQSFESKFQKLQSFAVVESARMFDVLASTSHSAEEQPRPEDSVDPTFGGDRSGDGCTQQAGL